MAYDKTKTEATKTRRGRSALRYIKDIEPPNAVCDPPLDSDSHKSTLKMLLRQLGKYKYELGIK